MIGRTRGMSLAMGAGLTMALAGSTTARAAIPYDAEITPGELRGIAWEGGDPWPAGYFEYLPSNFNAVPPDHLYPLLVTLGGIGTTDDPSNCPGNADWCTVAECEAAPGDPDGICRVYRRGPSVEIRNGVWNDVERPFIVISPQNAGITSSPDDYDRDRIDDLVTFVINNYPVDPRRMYLLGNSQGGRAVMQYTSLYNRRMAAVTIGPGGTVADADAACMFEDTAFWAFHGEDDDDANIGVGVFDPCLIVEQVRMFLEPDQYPMLPGCVDRVDTPIADGRMTMFYSTGHNAWTPAFENVTNGFSRSVWLSDQFCGYSTNFYDYSAALDPDGVYTWLLDFDRPSTDAGMDLVIPGTETEFLLSTITEDDDPISYTWTQIDGPPVTIIDADQADATVTDLVYDQAYTFEVYAIDSDQQWDIDEIVVTVEAEVLSESTGEASSSGTSGGDSDTTTGEPPGSTTSTTSTGPGPGLDSGSGGGPGSGSGDGPGPGPGSGLDSGSASTGGSSGGTETAGADGTGSGSGCGCTTQPRSGWSGLLGLFGLVTIRRRRRA